MVPLIVRKVKENRLGLFGNVNMFRVELRLFEDSESYYENLCRR